MEARCQASRERFERDGDEGGGGRRCSEALGVERGKRRAFNPSLGGHGGCHRRRRRECRALVRRCRPGREGGHGREREECCAALGAPRRCAAAAHGQGRHAEQQPDPPSAGLRTQRLSPCRREPSAFHHAGFAPAHPHECSLKRIASPARRPAQASRIKGIRQFGKSGARRGAAPASSGVRLFVRIRGPASLRATRVTRSASGFCHTRAVDGGNDRVELIGEE